MLHVTGRIVPLASKGEYVIDVKVKDNRSVRWIETQRGSLVNVANVSIIFAVEWTENKKPTGEWALYAHTIGSVPEDADHLLWKGTKDEVDAMIKKIGEA